MDFIEEGLHYWNFDSIQEFETHALIEIDKVCRNNNIHYYLAYGTLLGAVRHGGSIPWDMDADIYMPEEEIPRFVKVAREQLPDDLWVNFYDINPDYIYTYPQVGRKGFSTDGMHVDIYQLFGLPQGEKAEKRYIDKIEWQRVLFRSKLNIWESRIPKFEKRRYNRFYRYFLRKYSSLFDAKHFTDKIEELGSRYSMFSESDNIYDGMRVFPARYFGQGQDIKYDGLILLAPDQKEAYLKHRYGEYMNLPKDRWFQYIRYTIVNEDISMRKAVIVSQFGNVDETFLNKLNEYYKVCGSMLAIVDAYALPEKDKAKAIMTAKSLKYFDKIFVNDTGDEERKKLIDMIAPTDVLEC